MFASPGVVGQPAAPALPIELQADSIRGRPDLETVAEGKVELKRGSVVLRADRLSYDQPADLARALGNVQITRDGDRFSGPQLELHLQRFEGFFLEPTYYFELTGGGGRAARDRLHRQPACAGVRRHLHELPARRLGRAGLAALGRPRPVRSAEERRHRARRGAALLRRAHPRRAGAQLPAHERPQVRLAAAEREPGQPQRLRVRAAVLLEHRAPSGRHHHAGHPQPARRRAADRVPLPRAERCRRGDARPSAAGPHRRPRAPCAALRPPRRSPPRPLRRAGDARVRRRVLEGLPPPAAHRGAAATSAGRSRRGQPGG